MGRSNRRDTKHSSVGHLWVDHNHRIHAVVGTWTSMNLIYPISKGFCATITKR